MLRQANGQIKGTFFGIFGQFEWNDALRFWYRIFEIQFCQNDERNLFLDRKLERSNDRPDLKLKLINCANRDPSHLMCLMFDQHC